MCAFQNREVWNILYIKGFSKKLFIVLIWVIIVVGIYRCSANLTDFDEDTADKVEEREPEKNKEETNLLNSRTIDSIDKKLVPDDQVRVLIMNQGYQGIYHTELVVECSEEMIIDHDGKVLIFPPNSEYILTQKNFEGDNRICITGKNNGRLQLKNIGRNSSAQYRGKLECFPSAEGIVVVNELPVEEYLYSVVPSEMPSAYPEEALKAQAISARTYTYFHKQSFAYPEWEAHMDDSTAFQVYMNCEEAPSAINAVNETRNQVLTYSGDIVESFYYSTSSGYNGGAAVWNDTVSAADAYLIESGEELYAADNEEGERAYAQFIDHGNEADVEYHEAWYRWTYNRMLDNNAVKKVLQKLYTLSKTQPQKVRIRSKYLSSNQLPNEKGICDIRILSRKKSGMVAGIMIETEHFRVSVMTQHVIRQALGCAQDIVTRKDGSSYTMGDLLPSAYFYIEKIYDKNGEKGDTLKQIIIHGAGYGHGCGMSQNGAKRFAEKGLTAAEILAYYYNGEIKAVDELYLTAD